MTKIFSIASWNVEHFGSQRNRRDIAPIIDFLAGQSADIVALFEVESSRVYRPILEKMPEFHFFITEGVQTQEILVGVRQGLPAYITQKIAFKSGQSTLRPGVLLTVKANYEYYPILFLHLKSMPDPKGFGLRNDMIRRAFDFQKVLAKSAGQQQVNYIFMGDLNTMGMDYYPRQRFDIPPEDEIAEIKRFSRYRNMRLLTKNAAATFSNGSQSSYPPADLDHVVAARHLQFRSFNGKDVDVRGWAKGQSVSEQDTWIEKYSDHSLLYLEVIQNP